MNVDDVAPLYATSGGKAMLALIPEDNRDEYFRRVQLEASTESTIVQRKDLKDNWKKLGRPALPIHSRNGLQGS
jgi:DNA-binding IclR family transcriptional regulator